MTVVRKSDSHQGGVKGIRKVCQLMERYFSLQVFTRISNKPLRSKKFQGISNTLEFLEIF